MKRYIDYLIESTEEKKYTFKIKVAGDLPENCEDCMETALQKYSVSRFAKGKSTPIQENLLDFPEVKNSSVTVFETEVDYPATSTVITQLLSDATGIPSNQIRVRTPAEEEMWNIAHENEVDQEDSRPLLGTEYDNADSQDLVGEKHVTNFLKGLVSARKETASEQVKGANEALLAKKLHSEKPNVMKDAGPAKSLFSAQKKD